MGEIQFEREERALCIVFRFRYLEDAKVFNVMKHVDKKKWEVVKQRDKTGKKLQEDLIQEILGVSSGWKYFKLAQDIDLYNALL